MEMHKAVMSINYHTRQTNQTFTYKNTKLKMHNIDTLLIKNAFAVKVVINNNNQSPQSNPLKLFSYPLNDISLNLVVFYAYSKLFLTWRIY